MARPRGAPSLSKSALLLSPCIRWAGPQAEWYDEVYVDGDEMSKRDIGTHVHQSIHKYMVSGNPEKFSFQLLNVLTDKAIKYLEENIRPRAISLYSEVPVGVNFSRAAVVLEPSPGAWADRNYPNGPGFIYGTADIVAVLNTGELYVADWKTGGTEGAKEQLLSLGIALGMTDRFMETYRTPEPTKRTLVTACLQVTEDGVFATETVYTPEQLQAHWDSMLFQVEDIGKRNDPVPGIHCTTLYCPHLAYCPAIENATQQMAEQAGYLMPAEKLVRVSGDPLTNEDAGATMALVAASKRQAKYIETRMKAYVESGGKVIDGEFEWSSGNNGWRWRKR